MKEALKKACSTTDLVHYAGYGEKWAALELGFRVGKDDFCIDELGDCCPHAVERDELQEILDNEIPPDCPHCGKLVDASPEDYEKMIEEWDWDEDDEFTIEDGVLFFGRTNHKHGFNLGKISDIAYNTLDILNAPLNKLREVGLLLKKLTREIAEIT
jgi:hypothetical protein